MRTTLQVFYGLLILLMMAGGPAAAQTRNTAGRIITVPDTVSCLFPVIPAFTALPRNDEGSSGPLTLPFAFNLYGKTYSQVWINTNGTLTFNGPYGTYTGEHFPVNGQPMIAPFWGDVDTRHAASGQVHYMMTPTALIVNWDRVGYHNGAADKTNTFQVIIGTKASPYIGNNATIKFAYNDMQWATTGGFGGQAATVGINGGEGNRFFEIGRFSEDSKVYDGPGGSNDGVNYLDYKCFYFDGTVAQNMPPVAWGLPPGNFVDIHTGDTADLDVKLIAPEIGQNVSLAVDTQGVCKVNYSITNGDVTTLKLRIIGDTCNAGFHAITITATDNGNPQQRTTIFLIVNVSIEMLDQTIDFPVPVDEKGNGHMALKATASSGLPLFYTVESGSAYVAGDSLYIVGGGQIKIKAYQFGNGLYNPAEKEITICVPLKQPGMIHGDAEVCLGGVGAYFLQDYVSDNLQWSISEGGTVQVEQGQVKVHWTAVGTHTVMARYLSPCSDPGPVQRFTVQVTDNVMTGPFTNLRPVNGHDGINIPITFSWSPIVHAQEYELYLWPDTAARPEAPLVEHVTDINYILYYIPEIMQYGATYKWQVVARNTCYTLEGPVQTFTFRKLPDLVVTDIKAPATGFSGQSFSVRWEVKNKGEGTTGSALWWDKIYLSTDQLLDSGDIQLGMVPNMSALEPGAGYANTVSFTLPHGISNKFYVLAVANATTGMTEGEAGNNTFVSRTAAAIQLTPPPDLQVTSLVPPTIAFAGQSITLKWTVTNKGQGPAPNDYWRDYLYLSRQQQLNTDSAILLTSFVRSGPLQADTGYTQTVTVPIPDTVSGAWFVHVVTDGDNLVYEHAAEGNNTAHSDSIRIVVAPPVDLVVSQVTAPATASNAASIRVSWRVENAGGAGTEGKIWKDVVLLSATPVLQEQAARVLDIVQRPQSLGPGAGYTVERILKIPAGVTGPYYLFVKTDADNLLDEYDFENNNTAAAQPVTITTPDLLVTKITAPATAASGKSIAVSWTVKNNGNGKAYNTRIKDRILLSDKPVFREADSRLLKEVVYQTGELVAGKDTIKQAMVTLPEGIGGNYYLYVQTDSSNAVYETDENNNILRSIALSVALSPWADLQITQVQTADTATAAGLLAVRYTGINAGNAATDTTWKDRIYLSRHPQWDTAGSILLGELPQDKTIGKGITYTINTTVLLPGELGDSTYYLYVVANAGRALYEHSDSVNNVQRSHPVYIHAYPAADLVMTSITAPPAGLSGTPVHIKWSVVNQGAATLPNQWSDGLYLSADTVWDSKDTFVKAFTHRGLLIPGAGYTDEQDIVLPNGLAGDYYLLLVADRQRAVRDADTTNNYRLVRPDGGDAVPMHIGLTPPANLTIASLAVPEEGIAGQPVKITWTVQNTGTGATAVAAWTDKIYLSKDLMIDTTDQVVGTYTRTGALAAGGTYTDSLQVFLPYNVIGNQVLIVKTDANDNVYERGAEENTASRLIYVTRAELSDLVVTDITLPETVVAGEPVTVQWTLKNMGDNPVRGSMQEGVYLSADTIRDVHDIVAGLPDNYYNLAPGASMRRSVSVTFNGLSLQRYYVLVQADMRNNIAETADDNNLAVSGKTMEVTVNELPLDVLKQRNLPAPKDVYYRIEIPDSLAGQSLLVSLQGDTVSGNNELYLRLGDMPTRAVHDYAYSEAFAATQEIVIPAAQAGTYYLLAHTGAPYSGHQSMSLRAGILHFGIRSVDAAKGGNTGMVTTQISGAKLDSVTQVWLRKGGQTIAANDIHINNGASLFVRFNLQGTATGVYDVVAMNSGGDTAVLPASFTLEAGSADGLVTNVVAPPSTRPMSLLALKVQFVNQGNTDIVNPVLKLTSLGGAPIAFEPAALPNATKELTLKLKELNGPPGILRPGASGTVVVYAKSTTVLGFMLMQNNQ